MNQLYTVFDIVSKDIQDKTSVINYFLEKEVIQIETITYAMILMSRFIHNNHVTQITAQELKKQFLISLLISMKVTSDYYIDITWISRGFGISLKTVKSYEIKFLQTICYQTNVNLEEFQFINQTLVF